MNHDKPMDPLPPEVQHWRRRRMAFAPKDPTPSKEGFEAFKRSLGCPIPVNPQVKAWLQKMKADPRRIRQPMFTDRASDWMS